MAKPLQIEIKTKVYGRDAAKAVALFFQWLGFSNQDCVNAGRAMIFIRVNAAGRTKWIWGGNSDG